MRNSRHASTNLHYLILFLFVMWDEDEIAKEKFRSNCTRVRRANQFTSWAALIINRN